MKLTKSQIERIKEFALNYYKTLDPTHDISHANRTIKLASYLAKKEKADIEVCKFGALLHQFHPERAKKVEKLLKKIGVKEDLIKELVHCVGCVDRKTIHKAETLEAKIVFGADKLQVIGPFGILREIAYAISWYKMDFPDAVNHTKKMENSCFKLLQTKTAKMLAKKPHKFSKEIFKLFDRWDGVTFK